MAADGSFNSILGPHDPTRTGSINSQGENKMNTTDVIVNQCGKELQFNAVRNLMDDDIVEDLLAGEIYTSNQMLFDDYCSAHIALYGEEFELAKANPVW